MKAWNRDKNSQLHGRLMNLNQKGITLLYNSVENLWCLLLWWVMSWSCSCEVCRNLDARDVIICSRRNSEFVQLECAEFGKSHVCITAVTGIAASFKCLISCFASAAMQEDFKNSYSRIILESNKIYYFHFKLSKFFLILFLRKNVIVIMLTIICFII